MKMTDESGNDELDPQDQQRFDSIMKHPEIMKYLESTQQTDALPERKPTLNSLAELQKKESQLEVLEQILEKKKSMAEENENLIKAIDLNGSLISHESLIELGDEKNADVQPSKSQFLKIRGVQLCQRI